MPQDSLELAVFHRNLRPSYSLVIKRRHRLSVELGIVCAADAESAGRSTLEPLVESRSATCVHNHQHVLAGIAGYDLCEIVGRVDLLHADPLADGGVQIERSFCRDDLVVVVENESVGNDGGVFREHVAAARHVGLADEKIHVILRLAAAGCYDKQRSENKQDMS